MYVYMVSILSILDFGETEFSGSESFDSGDRDIITIIMVCYVVLYSVH